MASLATPSGTAEVVNKYNFNFRKKYGQNFLVDRSMLDKIVSAADVTDEDCVLEIGPGIGTMTQLLAESARHVIVVEIDENLIPILKDTLSEYDNVSIINNDILKVDIQELVDHYNEGRPIKVVANLPYYITTPIIMGLLENKVPLKSITVMVQKEVAERMQEGPGTKDYGALSLAVQYYSKPRVVTIVPPECFMPRPNVASAVINLELYEELPVKADNPEYMFRIIRASFNQRRKTLANGLSNDASLNLTRDDVYEALREMGKSESVRGETFSLSDFAAISNILVRKNK